MSKLVLYSLDASPPCRAVLMTAEAIGVTLEIRETNLFNKDHLTEDFLKINPQHTIPVLDDNGFILWDSHAIMCYLTDKYSKDDSLYPKDLQKRAVIAKHLYYDCGVIFNVAKGIFKPILYGGETEIRKENRAKIEEVYSYLNKVLEGKKWLAGDSYTLADISCITTVSCLVIVRSLDGFPNLQAWLERCEEQLPGYEKQKAGNNALQTAFRSKLSKI